MFIVQQDLSKTKIYARLGIDHPWSTIRGPFADRGEAEAGLRAATACSHMDVVRTPLRIAASEEHQFSLVPRSELPAAC